MATETLAVHILDKDYQVVCPQKQREALIQAAAELDKRMKAIRQTGTVIGVERIAVMAALNLAHEVIDADSCSELTKCMEEQCSDNKLIDDMSRRIDSLFSH